MLNSHSHCQGLSCEYSEDGHRVKRVNGDTQILEIHNQLGQLIYEADLTTGESSDRLYLKGHLIAKVGEKSDETLYYHNNMHLLHITT